jgi:hypothetical protein
VDEVERHLWFARAPADAEHEHGVAVGQAARAQVLVERRLPALVVRARGQLGDVVGRRVGLEVADLAEVVDGVRGVPRAAADPEDEESPAAVADRGQPDAIASMSSCRELPRDVRDLGQEPLGVAHGRYSNGSSAAISDSFGAVASLRGLELGHGQRPLDADLGVVVGDPALGLVVVVARLLVDDVGSVGEHAEAVREADRAVGHPHVLVGQFEGLHSPNVGEPRRMSTITSTIVPVAQRTSLAAPPGLTWKCIPRTIPRPERDWLS